MKALSLKQPWAELVAEGRKTIEIRTWNTNYRGRFYVHASGNVDEGACEYYHMKNLTKRAIIGEAELVDVKVYNNREEFLKDNDKHMAKIFKLPENKTLYGFILTNAKKRTPKPMPGQLGFFDAKI